MSHLKKVVVIEVEYNEHLKTYGARCLWPHRSNEYLRNVGSVGGATIIQVEEWIVDIARGLHITLPGIIREAGYGEKD